jgi:molybdopterin molybdotransferase
MDNSAMDGYAVQAASLKGASRGAPRVLPVVQSVAAGDVPRGAVPSGKAVRIMTGATVPQGADAVVPFEDTDESERTDGGGAPAQVAVYNEVTRGENVRPAGQDIEKGQRVMARGTTLRAPDIGVLASLGYERASVVRRPTVAIIATGDELVEPGNRSRPGQVFNSNSYGLAASVLQAGGIPIILGIAQDNLESIGSRIQDGLGSDILVTSAGVSKGDYDVVKDVLTRYGEISFWSVRMRPAKPLAFGLIRAPDGRAVPHLGLPGNPVSALVAFEQFGRVAIHKMMGKGVAGRPTISAVLEDPIYNRDGRRVYARVVVTRRDNTYYARLTGHQSSNLLTSMARANGLAICPEDLPVKEAGEVVTVQMVDWPESVF